MTTTRWLACLILFPMFWAGARADAIPLRQADGSELVLPAPAERLVTLSPHLAELVYAAGAGERLIASVEYSEYPPEAAQLPRIGDAFRIDTEAILALRPDLVLAWDSGNPKVAVRQLGQLGLAVWSIEIRQPGDIAATLRDIGQVAGNPESAAEIATRLDHRLAALAQRYESVERLDYFYQVGEQPLFTINGEHLISQGLSLCGGRNIFADEAGLAFQVGQEAVILADPDVMFAPALPDAPDPLEAWRQWTELAAVERNALFALPADEISRATPRWLDSIELACTLMHGLRSRSRVE
jgi:iron complex transport system substrate-binding protein